MKKLTKLAKLFLRSCLNKIWKKLRRNSTITIQSSEKSTETIRYTRKPKICSQLYIGEVRKIYDNQKVLKTRLLPLFILKEGGGGDLTLNAYWSRTKNSNSKYIIRSHLTLFMLCYIFLYHVYRIMYIVLNLVDGDRIAFFPHGVIFSSIISNWALYF